MKLYSILYNIFFVPILIFSTKILGIIFPKMRSRNQNFKSALNNLNKLKSNRKHTIWIHSASMGEFEQAKPIIESLKTDVNNKNIQIVCTFFSSSGYNTQKDYFYADSVCYLPIDTIANSKKFINKIKPNLVIFIRYELWLNYLNELKKQKISTLLINATFPTAIKKYKFLGRFYVNLFNLFDKIYTTSDEQTQLFSTLKNLTTEIISSSDTRIDRIMQKVSEAKLKPILQRSYFNNNKIIIVAGSTWEVDENYLIEAYEKLNKIYNNKLGMVLAPHEPTTEHITKLKTKTSNLLLLSEVAQEINLKSNNNNNNNFNFNNSIIVVDSIGKLLKLYGVADAAYVGGAFGIGVHSLTEPAGYSIPICTGKNCYNSPDALKLSSVGALTIAHSKKDIFDWIEKIITDKNFVEASGAAAGYYIKNASGATKTILSEIYNFIDRPIKNN